MTQNDSQTGPGWRCWLCPANSQTHPHQTVHTHREMAHPEYEPEYEIKQSKDAWEELLLDLLDKVQLELMRKRICNCCAILTQCEQMGKPCKCNCHEQFDLIEKLRSTL